MGRAMLIICAGVLISLGIIGMSTADMGLLLTQNTTTYANDVSAKNAAHTGTQMAMQEISDDTLFAQNRGPDNKWKVNLDESDDDSIYVYIEYLNDDYADNEYWKSDSIRIVSEGIINSKSPIVSRHTSKISSVYLMAKFSSLVPDFTGALQFPTGFGSITANGSAHGIKGKNANCPEDKPPVTVSSEATKDSLDNEDMNMDGEVAVDTSLSYQPTDELIERLEPQATTLNSDFDDQLGSANDPGVFFVEGEVKLTGKTEGYGILVIRDNATMDMDDPDLSVAGNFTWNGLVIFENANIFKGSGTPTINGSVLVGDTEGEADIDITLDGDIEINYDCTGENYAKKAAANSTDQKKYTRVVSFEET